MTEKVTPIRKDEEAEFWGNADYYGWLLAKRVLQLSTLSQRELAARNIERIKK